MITDVKLPFKLVMSFEREFSNYTIVVASSLIKLRTRESVRITFSLP